MIGWGSDRGDGWVRACRKGQVGEKVRRKGFNVGMEEVWCSSGGGQLSTVWRRCGGAGASPKGTRSLQMFLPRPSIGQCSPRLDDKAYLIGYQHYRNVPHHSDVAKGRNDKAVPVCRLPSKHPSECCFLGAVVMVSEGEDNPLPDSVAFLQSQYQLVSARLSSDKCHNTAYLHRHKEDTSAAYLPCGYS